MRPISAKRRQVPMREVIAFPATVEPDPMLANVMSLLDADTTDSLYVPRALRPGRQSGSRRLGHQQSQGAKRAHRELLLGALCAAAILATSPATAFGAEVFFPEGAPPPTQVTRSLSLKDAAQRGVVALEAKGTGTSGDQVAIQVKHKKVRGPITVTVRVEFTVPPRVTAELQEVIANTLRDEVQTRTEAELNRNPNRTRSGDPVIFKLLYAFRAPDAEPRFNYHQVMVINPSRDLAEPDPAYRSNLHALGVPNRFGNQSTGTFSVTSLDPRTMAHETLHLAGLDDRYADFYRVGGKDYPLPQRGMTKSQLAEFARTHQPPLPGPPTGRQVVANLPGTGRCDQMGTGFADSCRRISRTDLDFFDSQAGIEVVARPGDVLLNKNAKHQNFGVGFQTTVFASPGSTTTARGIAAYCLDHDRTLPIGDTFDVLGPASEVPGYESVGALLNLSGRTQLTLEESSLGMQAAIWNLTDASPLDTSGAADEARALLAQAGVAENSIPGGLPAIADPNGSSEATGSIDTSGTTLEAIESPDVEAPPSTHLVFAQLYPNRISASRPVAASLLLSVGGTTATITIAIERRRAGRWKAVRSLPARSVEPGRLVIPLALGRVQKGTHRLIVTAVDEVGAAGSLTVPLTITR